MSLQSAIKSLCRASHVPFSQTHYFLEGDDLSSLASRDAERLRKKVPEWIESGVVVVLAQIKFNHKARSSVHYLSTLRNNMIQWFDRVARKPH